MKVDVGTLGTPAPGSAAEIPLAALEALPLPDGGETLADAAAATAASGSRKHSTPPRVRHGGDGRRRGHRTLRARRGGARYGSPGGAREGYGREGFRLGGGGVASKVAMHAVAISPRFLDSASVPEDVMEGEMAILRAQTENAGKPANIVEKIVAGRMKKFYEETCLSNQKFVDGRFQDGREVVDGEDGLALGAFVRVKVGEGIEVQATDFAAEVAATVADSK